MPCPKCGKWTGKILIDDVWSGGKASDGPYPLMSQAMAGGLYHPNCKDGHSTYFPDISDEPEKVTKKEMKQAVEAEKQESRDNLIQRNIDKFDRLSNYSLDDENKKQYDIKKEQWKEKAGIKSIATDKHILNNNFKNVTEEWYKKATPNSHKIVKSKSYVDYKGNHFSSTDNVAVFRTGAREKEVATLLEDNFGGEIELMFECPGVTKTPDYIYKGDKFDLKELNGSSDKAIYNAIHKKKEQADNFIIDISNIDKELEDIAPQIDYIYSTKGTKFVE